MTKKTRFDLLDLNFAAAMCDNMEDGLKDDRTVNGWKGMDWNVDLLEAYEAKILRHLHAWQTTGDVQHLAAIACNANIIWHKAIEDK